MENVILTLLAAALLARQVGFAFRKSFHVDQIVCNISFRNTAQEQRESGFVSAANSRLSDSIIHLSDLRSQHDLHRCSSLKLQDVEHLRVFHRKLEPLRLVALFSSHYLVFLPFLLSQRIVMKSHFFPNTSLLCSVGLGVFGR